MCSRYLCTCSWWVWGFCCRILSYLRDFTFQFSGLCQKIFPNLFRRCKCFYLCTLFPNSCLSAPTLKSYCESRNLDSSFSLLFLPEFFSIFCMGCILVISSRVGVLHLAPVFIFGGQFSGGLVFYMFHTFSNVLCSNLYLLF